MENSRDTPLTKYAPYINMFLTAQNINFSVSRSQGNTEFLFNFSGISERGLASHETAEITFAQDEIVFRSAGSQIRLTASDDKMRDVFSEILNRRIFAAPAFQTNVAYISPYIEPIATILRRLIGKVDGENHASLLPNTMLYNLVRHVAYVWPNTNSPELSLSPTDQPPLAIRLALDYIYSRRGMVKSVNDVASHTNVGLRALETSFSDRLGIGIKRYCKCIMLRKISEQVQNDNQSLTQIASEFGVSNVARLRKELKEYSTNHTYALYPWEIYDLIREDKLKNVRSANSSINSTDF